MLNGHQGDKGRNRHANQRRQKNKKEGLGDFVHRHNGLKIQTGLIPKSIHQGGTRKAPDEGMR